MSLSIYLGAINQQLIAAHHGTRRGNYLFEFFSWSLQIPLPESGYRQAYRVGDQNSNKKNWGEDLGFFHVYQALARLGFPAASKAVLRASLPGHLQEKRKN